MRRGAAHSHARLQRNTQKDRRSVDLISNVLPFGRLWYGEPIAVANAIGYAMHRSRSHDVVVHVYDDAGYAIEMQKHAGPPLRSSFKTLADR